jgi:hypothetical protein
MDRNRSELIVEPTDTERGQVGRNFVCPQLAFKGKIQHRRQWEEVCFQLGSAIGANNRALTVS